MATLRWVTGIGGETWLATTKGVGMGVALAAISHEPGAGSVGRYRGSTYMPFTPLPGHHRYDDLKRILETTVALLLEDE